MLNDVSKDFKWNERDAEIGRMIVTLDKTPEAIKYFAEVCGQLTDYAYWFYLSTLWVSYSGWSDLNLWKQLFSSDRPKRFTSIMKPSELERFKQMSQTLRIYRAHRPGETNWIAYTIDKNIAFRFARERGVNEIKEYKVKKRDVLALFLRRGEKEVIVLDHEKTVYVRTIEVDGV